MPDDRCPDWLRRDKGFHCQDCNKLILPTESQYLSNEICSPCQNIRESNKKFIRDEINPTKGSLTKLIGNFDKYTNCGYSSHFKKDVLINVIKQAFSLDFDEMGEKGMMVFDSTGLSKISSAIGKNIDEFLSIYTPLPLDNRLNCFYQVEKILYKNQEFEFEVRIDKESGKIFSLISWYHTINEALVNQDNLILLFGKGLTYRDEKILLYIQNAQKNNIIELSNIFVHFEKLLPSNDLLKSLQKLEMMGFLKLKKNWTELTFKGKAIIF